MEGIRSLVEGIRRCGQQGSLYFIEKLKSNKGNFFASFLGRGHQQTLEFEGCHLLRVQVTQSNLLELFLLSVYQLGDTFLTLCQCLTSPVGAVVDVTTVSPGYVE